ncbi:MAG: galactose oxidase [Bacteroidetes bacterium]|nr:galactose oxidase [Bacteroidota bacterium]
MTIIARGLLYILLLISCTASAQSYGLGFHSHTEVQDRRTSLDLFPNTPWCPKDSFTLSFELSFLPGHHEYFGYIFRMIDDDRKNIDFIYDERSNLHRRFKMVLGDDLTHIAFDLDSACMFRRWNKFRITFDPARDRITFRNDSNSFVQEKVGLSPNSCLKLFFGTNQYRQFQVTDVPPMKIRNVRITRGDRLQFNWPLDERDSLSAHELVAGADGRVLNPIWIRDEHYSWRRQQDLLLNGFASVAFNPQTEQLYIADGDSLLTWSVSSGELSGTRYATGPQPFNRGNQSLYAPLTSTLYNIYIDHQLVTGFDFTKGIWDQPHKQGPVTDFWHFNKFFSAVDTSIYLIGGYGHFQYRNVVFRYHLPTHQWDTVSTTGDHLVPRYLFALAATPGADSAYILGGYGSQTGQQILNPQNIYDMMVFDVRQKKFKKLYEIKPNGKDFAFANSLVLDPHTRSYYGLIFPNGRYASQLQLIKGSLDGPAYQLVGDTIPYSFHDVTSASDLFFAPASGKFLAVTLLIDTLKRTHLRIYSLTGPPVTADSPYPPTPAPKQTGWLKYMLGIGLATLIITAIAIRRKTNKLSPASQPKAAAPTGSSQPATPTEPPPIPQPSIPEPPPVPTNQIYLFGEMQIFDKDGVDITRQFTPLIRELFLLILLYSVRKGTGVSSDKLTEILWSDKSTAAARNNRSVNIAKLKTLLDRLGHVQLSKDTGYWKIDIDPATIHLDYHSYLAIVKDKRQLSKQKINELADITRRGSFLSNIEFEWLDEYKSDVSNEIIDTYLHFARTVPLKDDPDFLVRLANYISYFDAVNEEAIAIKCKALALMGKHSLAKTAFDTFVRQYKTIYGEDFGKDFQQVVESWPDPASHL